MILVEEIMQHNQNISCLKSNCETLLAHDSCQNVVQVQTNKQMLTAKSPIQANFKLIFSKDDLLPMYPETTFLT